MEIPRGIRTEREDGLLKRSVRTQRADWQKGINQYLGKI